MIFLFNTKIQFKYMRYANSLEGFYTDKSFLVQHTATIFKCKNTITRVVYIQLTFFINTEAITTIDILQASHVFVSSILKKFNI